MLQQIKHFFGSTIFSNILAIVGIIISIFALTKASQATQTIKSMNIDGYSQNAQIINNNGANREEIKQISDEGFANKMDRLYETIDIIQKVSDNPNLHFAINWYGTQQEYDELDRSELPPHITYYISD